MNGQQNGHLKVQHLNTNTYVSMGMIVLLLGGFAFVMRSVNEGKTDIRDMKSEILLQALTTKNELSADIKDLKNRMTAMESTKNSWTSTDMFKWAVHLQQSNPQIKVPEPEVNTK